ncbi:MAG TPA: hypothetical protein VMR14_19910 [Streptosporangiaceae bacterium]|nr:hypothetical protein [Streptosporangiaceae bacterium]
MLNRWQGWIAAAAATLIAAALAVTDLTDAGMRRWWLAHALTTDTVSGLLVLLITVLVVDQLVRIRQLNDRAQAVAAQSAIMMAQATRSVTAVSAVVDGSGDRASALDEVRTYMVMLLVSAPVLIDGAVSRAFLEQSQGLGGELARALTVTKSKDSPSEYSRSSLDKAVASLRTASLPLLRPLGSDERVAAMGVDTSGD